MYGVVSIEERKKCSGFVYSESDAAIYLGPNLFQSILEHFEQNSLSGLF